MTRGLVEERFGGDLSFQETDRGTENVYGERIDLLRAEATWGSAPRDGHGWTWQGGGTVHRQESTYGTTQFNAQEWTANLDAYHSGWSWSEGLHLRGGMSLLWDVYTDETPASSDMNVWVPAVFGEYAGESGRWSWIHGLRIERPSDQGMVVAPPSMSNGRHTVWTCGSMRAEGTVGCICSQRTCCLMAHARCCLPKEV